MSKQNTPTIQRGITRINVAGNRVFAHPFTAPNYYKGAMEELQSKNQALPSGEDFSYLLHAGYCGPESFQAQPESQDLRSKMNSNYFWLAQRNLWVPEKYQSAHGVFVVDDKNGVGLDKELDVGKLESSLKGGRKLKNGIRFSEDETIGFAPRATYSSGEMSSDKFAKDGFMIISNKPQGAKRLAEVASSKHFQYKPYTWIVEPTNKPIQSLSAVSVYDGLRLDFDGGYDAGDDSGCASGVLASGEARAKK